MSIGWLIGTIVIGVVGNLIAAYTCETYVKKRDKGNFKAEKIALQLLALAVSILPDEDRAEYYDRWLSDCVPKH